jgi:hypothetical protein
VFTDNPAHDWASHDADAWRTLSLSWKFLKPSSPESPLIDKLLATKPGVQTLGQMRQQYFRKRANQRADSL